MVDGVAQLERSNNKYYASAFRYIQIRLLNNLSFFREEEEKANVVIIVSKASLIIIFLNSKIIYLFYFVVDAFFDHRNIQKCGEIYVFVRMSIFLCYVSSHSNFVSLISSSLVWLHFCFQFSYLITQKLSYSDGN